MKLQNVRHNFHSCSVNPQWSQQRLPPPPRRSSGCTVLYRPELTLYSGLAPILQNSTHPHLVTRPPASPDTGRDGCEDARLGRMEAAGPGTSWLQNWLRPQSRSNQRPDFCNSVNNHLLSRGDPAIVYLDGVKPPSPSGSAPISSIPDKSQLLRHLDQPTDPEIEQTGPR